MEEVIVRLMDMPISVNGVTSIDDNGDYNVYINSRHGDIKRKETLNHELLHIVLNHFYTPESREEKEREIKRFESSNIDIDKLLDLYNISFIWGDFVPNNGGYC